MGMKVAVMVDSNSGIMSKEGEKMGVFVVPMPVIIDGETYYEGVNLTLDSFFEYLIGGRHVTTSQPSPGDLVDKWEEVLKSGYDEIIYIPMSSGLSDSCATATMLAADFDGKVQVADNHRISVPQYGSVLDALKLAAEGKNALQIKEALEETAFDCSIYISVDTLEFLKRGGRVTPAAAAIGNVLNIKPILTIQGDVLEAFAKVRGTKKGRAKIIESIRKDLNTRFGKEDPANIRIATAGTFRNPDDAENWRQEVEDNFPGFSVIYFDLGCSVGTHTGPEAFAAGIYKSL
ncbi:DegV family protein [Frisingicoccus sp.]|uniref:DegV family protein n=1 Tax=Frisingicoccus sp. TaxID=1918627 RepID=UPI00386FE745